MLRSLFCLALLAGVSVSAAPELLPAQQPTTSADSLQRRLDQMQRQIDSLRRDAERQTERLIELDERRAAAGAPPTAKADSTRRAIPSSLGIYGKPFVRRFGSGTSVGGYVDLEFANNFTTKARSFDQHRLVPFLYSEITDRLHFGTEIEFEHREQNENENSETE